MLLKSTSESMFMKNISMRTVLSVLLAYFITTTLDLNNVSAQDISHDLQATNKLKLLFESNELGDINEIKKLIKSGANVNVLLQSNDTLLKVATKKGNKTIVELLLNNGAEPNLNDRDALVTAAYKGEYEIAKMLVAAGANVNNNKHSKHQFPLQLASNYGHEDIVGLLLKKGANPNNDVSLIKAVSKGSISIVKMLVEAGADINKKHIDSVGRVLGYALNKSIEKCDYAIASFLINRGANLETQDIVTHSYIGIGRKTIIQGTPLHYASYFGCNDITKLLLKSGSHINAKNQFEKTPMDIATERKNTSTVELLTSSENMMSTLKKYKLTIQANPDTSNIKLLNSGLDYAPGIELKPGWYHIMVSKEGYNAHKMWYQMKSKDTTINVNLIKKITKIITYECDVKDADTIVFVKDGTMTLSGDLLFQLADINNAKPAGPKVIHVIQKISPEYNKLLKEKNIYIKEGEVYLGGPGSSIFNEDSELKYICNIDLNQTDKDIERIFMKLN